LHHSIPPKKVRAKKAWFDLHRTLGARLLCGFLCCVISIPQQTLANVATTANARSADAYQAAEILQIRPAVDRLLALEQEGNQPISTIDERLSLRALILRKIFVGTLDVRSASNKVKLERSYTYGIMQREQAKQASVNQFLNQLNFAQFATLYTIEPYSRIHLQFKQSAILGCIGAGIGTTLPIIGILYNKHSKAHDTSPPPFLSSILNGGPVDASQMPPVIERFLNTPKPGDQISRKETMFALWKKQYGVDAANKSSLCSLQDNSGKSMGVLGKRISLLSSLNTFIEDFDPQLLALLQMVQSPSRSPSSVEGNGLGALGLKVEAIEAAHLLKIEPTVQELLRLNKEGGNTSRRAELEINLLETVLAGMLDMRAATGKIDQEVNYAYDVVLSHLLRQRGQRLQRNYDANFIQTGIFGAIAGLLFLKGQSKAGNEMFVIQGSIGTGLSALGLWLMRGGSRKVDTPPNSLAQFFHPNTQNEYRFSPLISDYLDSPEPGSKDGKSRRDFLLARWKERHVATMNLDDKTNQLKLAAMSPTERDTIKVVRNRIDLMQSLKARLEEIDSDFLALIEATEPAEAKFDSASSAATTTLNPAAAAMAELLGVQPRTEHLISMVNGRTATTSQNDKLNQQLFLTRRVFSASLDTRKAIDQLNMEIAVETTARDRVLRQRDLALNLTNNANFFQISILGIIASGPLGLSADPRNGLYSNRLNIVSGYLVGGLTAATVLEKHGGIRMTKAAPNTLASVFGIDTAGNCQLSPTLTKFLNSPASEQAGGLSRKGLLMKYWKTTKVVSVNVDQRSTQEKLAALGPSHHYWSETAKLMTNRIRMLYDIRAVIGLMDVGLSDLLRAID